MQRRYLRVSRGFRSDLEDVTDAIRLGVQFRRLIEDNLDTYIKYSSGINRAYGALLLPQPQQRFVHVLHGDTGTGKTRGVYDRHGDEVFAWGQVKDWFDGYNGEEVILCDDFTYDPVRRTLGPHQIGWWLKFLDRYPMRLEIKGGSVRHQAKSIYITTNQDPMRDWWINDIQKHVDAFWRRVTRVMLYGKPQGLSNE